MNRKELIKKFLEFFESRGHELIPNASLIPENDPTVLFTTAGMHPIVAYLSGQHHPLGRRLCSIQKCIRTGDIEEVGDTYHHTFFEMLGNWSLEDYWKEESINYSFDFLTKVLKIPIERMAITCFKGDKDAPKDESAANIWISLGIPKERIAFLGKIENWWGLAGKTGPCGPDTEIFYWKDNSEPAPKKFNQEDKRWVEIWNNVFMQYHKDESGKYNPIKQKNIDTGMGVERTIAILNKLEDNYLTDMFYPIIKEIEKLSKKKYEKEETKKAMRIIADHLKASVFIISEGITPSNNEQGYVLRRLIRRAVRYAKELEIKESISKIANSVFPIYEDYKELQKNKNKILKEIEREEEKFKQTLERGENIIKKYIFRVKHSREPEKRVKINGETAFLLYQSYGFPIELTKEIARQYKVPVDEEGFKNELKKHQELSRTASEGRFKSGLADSSEETIKLHTASHLLLAALRVVLKNKNIIQRGSNITPERLRLDFSFPRKLTEEEIKKVENLVNEKIKESLEVIKKEMPLTEAKKIGASGIFDEKYKDKVFVYSIGKTKPFSIEICSGPHVKNLRELGHFRIKNEESSSSGVRRIKAVLE